MWQRCRGVLWVVTKGGTNGKRQQMGEGRTPPPPPRRPTAHAWAHLLGDEPRGDQPTCLVTNPVVTNPPAW